MPGGAWDGDPAQRPRLDVTYTADAPRFHEPETLYGNGADLRWDRFDGSTGNAFTAYEVHRSATAGFTPSGATRIASIGDVNVTAFRDTTAAPSQTFTYKIVVNGSPSAARTVTLPADGQARKVLQPDVTRGKATFIDNAEGATTCSNYGAEPYAYVGNDSYSERTLLGFDLRDIPAGATVTSATMSAYMSEAPWEALTVGAHRVTAGWEEGTGNWDCTHDGASWAERSSGTNWATPGGDYVATAAATKAHTATDVPGWDNFDVSSVVRSWVDGTAPNHGILLRATNESPGANNATYLAYHTDDYLSQSTLRPKLAVSYTDATAKAVKPTVAVSSPSAGDTVRDTVAVDAAASDDRRVEKVEFLVDGTVKSTDTAAPYAYAWDTKTATNGSHNVTIRATDDAANITTSPATAVTVANSAPPSTA